MKWERTLGLDPRYDKTLNALLVRRSEIFGDDWKTALSFFLKLFEKNHLNWDHSITWSKDLLNFFGSEKIYSGIIFNKNGSFFKKKKFKKLDWEKYFKNVLGATDLDFDKPSKAL